MKTVVDLIAALTLLITLANAAVNWPYGKYGLPKPKSGCPENTWLQGWRRQYLKLHSRLSFDSQMDAQGSGSYVNRTFCMKNNSGVILKDWRKGSYCIYKANNTLCPTGMNQGYFVWDDNYSWWTYTRNKQGGTLPDGLYNSDTKIMYCCQNKGKWYLPIELPVQHPFYLLPRNNSVVSFPRCQLVKWTMNWLEYIDYPTVDSGKIVSKSGGDHVFVKDLRLGYPSPGKIERAYYCYYQGCRHEMDGFEGVLSSPRLNNNPQFEKCSWLITVDEYLKISLQFTQLNLNNCQESRISIYDGNTEQSRRIGTYCSTRNYRSGHKIVSSANHMLVVFTSNNRLERLVTRPSFEAKYSAQTDCHYNMYKNEGVVSSPNSNIVPRYVRCSWLITVEQSHLISIKFTRLEYCRGGSILIYDGTTEESTIIGASCNISKLSKWGMRSTGNQMLLVLSFKNPTNQSIAPPRFEAKYNAITRGDSPNSESKESSKSRKIRDLSIALVAVSLFFIIILLLVLFRGKMKFLHKSRSQSNGQTGQNVETREQKSSADRSTYENGAFTTSNIDDRNPDLRMALDGVGIRPEQNSDGDDAYMELVTENMQPENCYQSLVAHGGVQSTDVDGDYVIPCEIPCVDEKAAS